MKKKKKKKKQKSSGTINQKATSTQVEEEACRRPAKPSGTEAITAQNLKLQKTRHDLMRQIQHRKISQQIKIQKALE